MKGADMQEYYKKVHDDALDGMRRIVGQEVEDSCADMKCALEYVKKHKTAKKFVEALDYYIDYKWAKHEIAAHAVSKTA